MKIVLIYKVLATLSLSLVAAGAALAAHIPAGRITSASVRYDQGAAATPHITETFAHDPNGALTNWASGTNSLSLAYDARGRFANGQCLYDALDNRIRAADGAWHIPNHADPLKRPLMECADDGTVRRHYIWSASRLLGFIENDTLTVAHSDDFGSVVALTDATGTVLHTAHYGSHGEGWGAAGAQPHPLRMARRPRRANPQRRHPPAPLPEFVK